MGAAIGLAATAATPRAKLAEQVYAQLQAELQAFQLVPGDRFSESDIGARLGVSRTPVREALFRLRNEGLLDVESKSGWFVRPIDFAQIEALYDLRVIVELAAVQRLCQRSTDVPELDALKRAWLVPAAERRSDMHEVGALDEDFHTALVSAVGNSELTRVHRDVTERIRIVRRLDFTQPARIDATYAEHGKILRAVMQRKADAAALLLRAHIDHSKAEVRKITLATLQELRAGTPPTG